MPVCVARPLEDPVTCYIRCPLNHLIYYHLLHTLTSVYNGPPGPSVYMCREKSNIVHHLLCV